MKVPKANQGFLVPFLLVGLLLLISPVSADLTVTQVTHGPRHHFFGYIGHVQNIPWNGTGRYLLALRTASMDHLPDGSEPADVVQIVTDYGAWLAESEVPKLFVNAEPGALMTGAVRDLCRTFPNQTEVTVAGSHFIQEDSPDEIGAALRAWMTA